MDKKTHRNCTSLIFKNPEILLLDEPNNWSRPGNRLPVVWRVIDELREKSGNDYSLTTHYMEEATEADHAVIINMTSCR